LIPLYLDSLGYLINKEQAYSSAIKLAATDLGGPPKNFGGADYFLTCKSQKIKRRPDKFVGRLKI